jgi:hypothetical protein
MGWQQQCENINKIANCYLEFSFYQSISHAKERVMGCMADFKFTSIFHQITMALINLSGTQI